MSNHLKLGIRLRKFNRVCPITGYREETIRVGSPVIVQTDRGLEYGEIVASVLGFPRAASHDVRLKKVIRYATQPDLEQAGQLQAQEESALVLASQKIKEHELPVKLIDLEYLFDHSRVVVYYRLAEGKKLPNLRGLSRDLAVAFSARVDMQPISAREEARLLGGLGPCGRSLCCSSWLEKPRHVTVKMVKDQGLPVSPAKTAGLCGRLMCCLEYEYDR